MDRQSQPPAGREQAAPAGEARPGSADPATTSRPDDRYDFRAIEAKWQTRWLDERTFRAEDDSPRPKHYVLEMFPYPSGAGLSVGHVKNYVPVDAYSRFKSMKGYNVLHPMGWDAFGQPAENEAIKRGRNPREMVPEYAATYRATLRKVGCSYDWDREIDSSLPEYYRWTQWLFLLLYKRGLAYRATAPINWCPSCKTGLANEEVQEGRCWRCDTFVEKRPMPQWFFRITAYADRLLSDLDRIQWSEGLKEMQRDWIGRSEGAEVEFRVPIDETSGDEPGAHGTPGQASEPGAHGTTHERRRSGERDGQRGGRFHSIKVFTTRPDTLWGATFLVLAPEHPLVSELTPASRRSEIEDYVRRAQSETEIERLNTERVKTGVDLGVFAINPVNGARVPVWIADYVLTGYGTGAIMAVPAHDQRDFEFARKFGIPVEPVFLQPGGPQKGADFTEALPEGGVMRAFVPGSGARVPDFPFAGMPNAPETVRAVIGWLERHGVGSGRINYRLRDWLISRQRYWGAPIPIIHCPSCGMVPVPDDQLPVLLPVVENYQPSGTGESPLANIEEFVAVSCPSCGGAARRETDTMGGYACSSWYFMRFADPRNKEIFAAREKLDRWLPVDLYSGGVEHARSHLLYSRFWTKVLFDAGYIGFEEPFLTLRNQGSMLAWTPGRRPRAGEGESPAAEDGGGGGDDRVIDWIVLKPEERAEYPEDQIVWRWTRMSKSKGNVVRPDDMCEKYGADSLRLYEMFVAPFEEDVQWSEDGINGAHRFAGRAWRWMAAALPQYLPEWRARIQEGDESTRAVRRKVHQVIRKVGEDLEDFRFNTAVAALMELVNDLHAWRPVEGPRELPRESERAVLSEALESLTLLLAPFAPHMAEEVRERLGYRESVYRAEWPDYDSAVAAEDSITLVVQVNGKLRDRITVPAGSADETLKAAALESPKVKAMLEDQQVKQVFVVRGKLVNIVLTSK